MSGNAVTLRAALIPTSSRIILYDTVYLQRLTIYDSLQNIVFSDTIHHPLDTLRIDVTVNKKRNFVNTFTVVNYCINDNPNNITISSATLVAHGHGAAWRLMTPPFILPIRRLIY